MHVQENKRSVYIANIVVHPKWPNMVLVGEHSRRQYAKLLFSSFLTFFVLLGKYYLIIALNLHIV